MKTSNQIKISTVKVHLQKKLDELEIQIKGLTRDLDNDEKWLKGRTEEGVIDYCEGVLDGMKKEWSYMNWILNYILSDEVN